jgi:hypothetical protein
MCVLKRRPGDNPERVAIVGIKESALMTSVGSTQCQMINLVFVWAIYQNPDFGFLAVSPFHCF